MEEEGKSPGFSLLSTGGEEEGEVAKSRGEKSFGAGFAKASSVPLRRGEDDSKGG